MGGVGVRSTSLRRFRGDADAAAVLLTGLTDVHTFVGAKNSDNRQVAEGKINGIRGAGVVYGTDLRTRRNVE